MGQQDHRHHQGGRSDYGRERGRSDYGWEGRRFQSGRSYDPRGGERGERWQTGSDRDRYQTGDERRYQSDWDEGRAGRGYGGYEGDRSYSAGGYPEEFGYRRDYGREGQSEGRYGRGGDEDARMRRWRTGSEEETGGDEYFGTGSHYGGGYGSAPGTRASSQGSLGESGYGGYSSDEWDERSEWLPESGIARGTSGSEEYMRSAYGSQSGYGRDYGQRSGRGGYGGQRYLRGQGQRFGGRAERYGSRAPGESQSGARTSFRGRGPKGYARSDDRLKEIICERLTDDPNIDATDVTIDVTSQVVTLSGTVDDRQIKYEIEELVERCGGVKDINNHLRVQSERFSSQSETSTGASALGGTGTASSRGASAPGMSSPSAGGSSPTSSTGTSAPRKN